MDREPEIRVCRDPAALAAEAAERIIAAAKIAIQGRGRFTLVLSGGSTPEKSYALLAEPQRRLQIDWRRTWLFFGDERCVPHDDSRSNYHLAAKSLLEPAKIDAAQVIDIGTDLGSPAQCAAAYESRLRSFFETPTAKSNTYAKDSGEFPRFDLILLGLGDDGHTASLFPGKPTLAEQRAWVTWSPPGVLPPPVDRVTFTLPVLNAAREVMFLVAGAGKATVLHEVLEEPSDVKKHPASGVHPTDGKLTWLLDEAAAAQLDRKH